jgi:hypothetical protein
MVLFLVNALAGRFSGWPGYRITVFHRLYVLVCCGPPRLPEVFPISDWVAMLKHGKIIAMAPSKEFLNTKYPSAGREFIFVKE